MAPITAPPLGSASSDADAARLSQRAAVWLQLGVSALAWVAIFWLLAKIV
ncbi:MAG: hypothetical protein H6907_14995 [Hyphomicrobiales bacterium]|nr:hypothetical protein [Hyphomicrobiales bacterium]